jgi:cell division protease FtsH
VSQFYKNLALWLVIGLIMIALFNVFSRPQRPTREISFSEFLDQVAEGQVQEVTIQGDDIRGLYRNGTSFRTFSPKDPELIPTLRQHSVRIQAEPPERTSWYVNLFISWFPMLLLLGVWIFFMRQMQSGGSKALSFGKSRAKLMSEKGRKVTFKDVAGV